MEKKNENMNKVRGGGEAVYGLGLLGALFYYISTAHNLTDVLFGIIKSVLWPAFLVYSLLATGHF